MDNFLYILSNMVGFFVGFNAVVLLVIIGIILIIKFKDLTGRF